MAHFGNVQTGYQMKEFQVIAPFIEDMKKLNFFALDFRVSIVFDSTVMHEMKKRKVSDKFVWRPIDNFVIKEGDDPIFLYELVGHSNYRIETVLDFFLSFFDFFVLIFHKNTPFQKTESSFKVTRRCCEIQRIW